MYIRAEVSIRVDFLSLQKLPTAILLAVKEFLWEKLSASVFESSKLAGSKLASLHG